MSVWQVRYRTWLPNIFPEILSWKYEQSQFVIYNHTSKFCCFCLCFVLFFAFLNSREKQIFKKLLNMTNDIFLVHLSLNDSDHYQKIKPIPSNYEKFSSFEAIKKMCHRLRENFKICIPKIFEAMITSWGYVFSLKPAILKETSFWCISFQYICTILLLDMGII